MSIAQTFTVTVQSTGSGNKYFIDGVQQDTIMIGAGLTYKFDQSDSSNSSHPLRFSTTSDGTHNSGSEYTTGVTTSGTPGSAGAYTQIEVEAGAPTTLYYYCTNHSGMGGQANTDGWGRSYWSQADWGDTNIVETGWGRNTWGYQSWGDTPVVSVTGFSITSSLGSVTSAINSTVTPTGLSVTSTLGTASSIVNVTVEPNGLEMNDLQGTAQASISVTPSITGLSTTAAIGVIDPNDQTVGLSSFEITSTQGTAVAPNEDVSVTGQSITSHLEIL